MDSNWVFEVVASIFTSGLDGKIDFTNQDNNDADKNIVTGIPLYVILIIISVIFIIVGFFIYCIVKIRKYYVERRARNFHDQTSHGEDTELQNMPVERETNVGDNSTNMPQQSGAQEMQIQIVRTTFELS